jgi:predicted ribosomally synthesized peptide with nif11-like leader
MSVDNVKAFFDKAEGDKGLQAKLKTLEKKSQANKKQLTEELIRIAAEAGFAFTPADLVKIRQAPGRELLDDELKHVTGGAGAGYYHCTGTAAKWLCENVTF